MKVFRRAHRKDGFLLKGKCEDTEDLWFLYNFISSDDEVQASTARKTQKESTNGTISTSVKRVQLSLKVDKCEFDGQAGGTLRISGRVCNENQSVRLNCFHTIVLQPASEFSLRKNEWDTVHDQKIREACDFNRRADTAVLLIQHGLANLILVSQSLSRVVANIQNALPKNRAVISGRAKAIIRFYGDVYNAIEQKVNIGAVKLFVIAGPGFAKDEFYEFLMQEAVRTNCRSIERQREKFIRVQASSAYFHSLNEIMSNPDVGKQMAETKAIRQVRIINQFYRMLNNPSAESDFPSCSASVMSSSSVGYRESELVCYGQCEVRLAVDLAATKILMVADPLFRSNTAGGRRFYVKLVEDAKKAGADVLLFSDEHSSGEQLMALGGVAAILRYPLPDVGNEENVYTFEHDNGKRGDN